MYMLFCFRYYYPDGGWDDFKGLHETIWSAKVAAETMPWHEVDKAQIVEVDGCSVVETGQRSGHREGTLINWSANDRNP